MCPHDKKLFRKGTNLINTLLFLQLNCIFVFLDDFPISEDKLLVREIWIIDMDELLVTNTVVEVDKSQKSTNKIKGNG